MKLLHLEHVEDYVFTGNYAQAVDTIGTMSDALSGKPQGHLQITTKYDGAPAIVFGVNPENNKFFVGTKGVFNKTPKICYCEDDIISHYGDKAELAAKLLLALDTLRGEYIDGLIPGDVFQGDIMYTRDSLQEDLRTVYFTPNTITYRANRNLPLGLSVLTRSLGIVVHTRYEGDLLIEMRARFDVDQSRFKSNRVLFIDPKVNMNDFAMTQLQVDTIFDIINFCDRTAFCIKDRSIYERHGKFLKMFINHCIRMGEPSPEVSMYEAFLRNRSEDELCREVTVSRLEFVGIIMMHKYITQAKKIILRVLNTAPVFFHEVDGHPTDGEGFVVVYHGVPCKFVDRMEFSKLNFANKRFAKA